MIQLLFTLPRTVEVADRIWELVLYPNHPGYDFRLCYTQFFEDEQVPTDWKHPFGHSTTKWLWLIENIAEEEDLRAAIAETQAMLVREGVSLIDPSSWKEEEQR